MLRKKLANQNECGFKVTGQQVTSCALEGFDEPQVRKLLSLPREARIVMVITAGKKGSDALIPQIRFEKSHYLQTI